MFGFFKRRNLTKIHSKVANKASIIDKSDFSREKYSVYPEIQIRADFSWVAYLYDLSQPGMAVAKGSGKATDENAARLSSQMWVRENMARFKKRA